MKVSEISELVKGKLQGEVSARFAAWPGLTWQGPRISPTQRVRAP